MFTLLDRQNNVTFFWSQQILGWLVCPILGILAIAVVPGIGLPGGLIGAAILGSSSEKRQPSTLRFCAATLILPFIWWIVFGFAPMIIEKTPPGEVLTPGGHSEAGLIFFTVTYPLYSMIALNAGKIIVKILKRQGEL